MAGKLARRRFVDWLLGTGAVATADEAELRLVGTNQALVEACNRVHAFDTQPVVERVEEGIEILEAARAEGIAALEELDFRRKGLAASLFFVLLLVVGLYLKIREIEADSSAARAGAARSGDTDRRN